MTAQALALAKCDNITPWPPMLAVDLALAIDPVETILQRHDISYEEWDHIANHPAFRAELVKATKEIRENGFAFKRKAAYQAETYLQDLDNMMMDPLIPPSIKVDIFKTLARLGELEPKDDKGGAQAGALFQLQINIG